MTHKMKKVLIVGCGSIGQQHIRALKKIGEVTIAAYRTRKGTYQNLPMDLTNIREFPHEKDAFNWHPDYMIISNPTSLHLEYVLKGIDNRVEDIFVEKPLANHFSDIKKELQRLSNYSGNITVGFNLRFHIIVKKIKELIESQKYGRVLKASLEAGQYLPSWHPHEDYRKLYAARKELGGGVLRTLCHEIDLAQYLFGNFGAVYGEIRKISDLEIDVDDYVCILANMNNAVKVEIKLDYLRPIIERKGEILFKKGLLRYDAIRLTMEYASYETRRWESLLSLNEYGVDIPYQDQMKAFIDKDFSSLCSLEEGINVMKVIELAEKSSVKKEMLCLT